MYWLRGFLSFVFVASSSVLVQAQELKLYFGLLHGHTSYSDGTGKPEEAFDMAKDAGLDFFACTEHNHSEAASDDGVFLTPPLYGKLIQAAREHTVPDEFLAIWGQEISTISSGNHAAIFFADQICDMPNGDFKFLYEEFLPNHPEVPFVQFNHPDVGADQRSTTPAAKRNNDYGIDDYDGDFDALVQAAGNHVALVELIIGPAFSAHTDMPHQNGKHEKDYLFYLNQGFRIAPSVGQDNHKRTWGKATHARMGVWAKCLTPEDFIDAIRERRWYASEDDNTRVRFTVNDQMMGSVIDAAQLETVSIKVSITDDDEPSATYRVRLFYDDAFGDSPAAVVETQPLGEGESELEFLHAPNRGGYYFVKITQDGDDHADDVWTAPVWIGRGTHEFARALAANSDDPEKEEIDWSEATDYVGEDVIVSGRVIRSFNFQNKAVFFNFDPDYENTVSLVLLASDFEAFGGADGVKQLQERLVNQEVRVRGETSLYRDERVQLRLTSPDQILSSDASEEGDEP